jgi:tetratricopeptide (TPR) repeat protein
VRRTLVTLSCLPLFLATACADTYLVLPFFNISKSPNLNWIGESVAETLGEALSSEGSVVLNRDDRVEAYRRLGIRPYSLLTKGSVVKIGQELDAEHVIFGQFDLKAVPDSAAKSRGSLVITAYILDLQRIKQGPEFREIGALEDLAAIEGHLAWQTLRFLKPNIAMAESQFRERHPAVRLDAIENYVRGLMTGNEDEQHRFFTQAARLDTRYSQPCFQLGRLLWKKKEYKTAAEWFHKVSSTDARYHEANFFLGLCRYYTGDFAGAREAFQIVAPVVPLNEVYNNLGAAESRANVPDALENFRRALEGDPNDTAYLFNVGYALWKNGNFADATRSFHAVLERDPKDEQASLLLDRCAKESGPRPGDTRTEGLERVKTNYEESAYWQLKAVLQPEKP